MLEISRCKSCYSGTNLEKKNTGFDDFCEIFAYLLIHETETKNFFKYLEAIWSHMSMKDNLRQNKQA